MKLSVLDHKDCKSCTRVLTEKNYEKLLSLFYDYYFFQFEFNVISTNGQLHLSLVPSPVCTH